MLMVLKRVRFQPTETIVILDTASDEELKECWLSKEDLARYYRDFKATLRALKKVKGDLRKLDQEEYCTRGLEKYQSLRQSQINKDNQVAVMQTILDVQRDHKASGITDDIGLRLSVRNISKSASDRALHQGREDAKVAGRIQVESGHKKCRERVKIGRLIRSLTKNQPVAQGA